MSPEVLHHILARNQLRSSGGNAACAARLIANIESSERDAEFQDKVSKVNWRENGLRKAFNLLDEMNGGGRVSERHEKKTTIAPAMLIASSTR